MKFGAPDWDAVAAPPKKMVKMQVQKVRMGMLFLAQSFWERKFPFSLHIFAVLLFSPVSKRGNFLFTSYFHCFVVLSCFWERKIPFYFPFALCFVILSYLSASEGGNFLFTSHFYCFVGLSCLKASQRKKNSFSLPIFTVLIFCCSWERKFRFCFTFAQLLGIFPCLGHKVQNDFLSENSCLQNPSKKPFFYSEISSRSFHLQREQSGASTALSGSAGKKISFKSRV